MAMRVAFLLGLAALAVVLLSPPKLPSCAYTEAAVFTFSRELPLEAAAGGQWEVLEPAYTRRSLVLAYRYLSGVKLTPEERKLWQTPAGNPPGQGHTPWEAARDWVEARKQVPGARAVAYLDNFRSLPGSYVSYLNCQEDAFRTAIRTLREKGAGFGLSSPQVRQWLEAQDRVFENCSGSKPAILPEAFAEAPPSVQADVAYQRAAAHFYAAEFERAAELFREIARTPGSPYREIAPYLAARCLIRRATLRSDRPDHALLARAEEDLKLLLDDPARESIREPVRRMLAFVQIRLYPVERLLAESRVLTAEGASPELPQAMTDYLYLLDRVRADGPEALSDAAARSDLTAWLLCWRDTSAAAAEQAYGRWRATSALPWLAAAMSKLGPGDARAEPLLAAAAAVGPESPAFPTVAFHSARLLAAGGKREEARAKLDALLSARSPRLSPSSRNLLAALRMTLARTEREFLEDAGRTSIAHEYLGAPELGIVNKTSGNLFDYDAARVFNDYLPLRLWLAAADSPALENRLRREVALAGWVRAFLIGDQAAVGKLTPAASKLAPELESDLPALAAAATPSQRNFAGVMMLLRNPGLRPEIRANLLRPAPLDVVGQFRSDNWWWQRTEPPDWMALSAPALRLVYMDGQVRPPPFLSPADTEEAARERTRLAALGCAGSYLAGRAVEYARANPEDPRVPEALHLAVRATRYGCTDDNTGKHSKQAFDLLHQRYPSSPWTKKMPYWFK